MIRPGPSARRAAARLCLVDFSGLEPTDRLERLIADSNIGGVVLFRKNVASAMQVAQLTAALQRLAFRTGSPPVWVSIDHEGGAVDRFTPVACPPAEPKGGPAPAVTSLPSAMALGATGDPALARLAGRVAGRELRALGIHLNFAPVLDINTNPANPVIGARAFGDSSAQVEAMGVAYIDGLQSAGVGAVAKHFPGHGDVTVDSHLALPCVAGSVERLEAIELVPFAAAARAGTAALMTAHVAYPALDPTGVPATISAPILQGILRARWRYEGLIVSDSLGMRAITDHFRVGEAAVRAVRAGCDLLLTLGPEAVQDEVLEHLALAIERGEIPQERLEESRGRIERAAARWGLGATPQGDLAGVVGSVEHAVITRQIAEAAVTLVRDRARMIPLEGAPVDVVSVPAVFGDDLVPPFAPWLRRYHPAVREMTVWDPVHRDAVGGSEAVIAVTCTRGTPAPSQVAIVRDLHRRVGSRLLVLAAGDPYDLLEFPEVPAYLATYGPDGPSLDAAARVMVGSLRPGGRLPITLPGLHRPEVDDAR